MRTRSPRWRQFARTPANVSERARRLVMSPSPVRRRRTGRSRMMRRCVMRRSCAGWSCMVRRWSAVMRPRMMRRWSAVMRPRMMRRWSARDAAAHVAAVLRRDAAVRDAAGRRRDAAVRDAAGRRRDAAVRDAAGRRRDAADRDEAVCRGEVEACRDATIRDGVRRARTGPIPTSQLDRLRHVDGAESDQPGSAPAYASARSPPIRSPPRSVASAVPEPPP